MGSSMAHALSVILLPDKQTNYQKKGPENITSLVEMVTSQLAIMRVMELIIYYINLLFEKRHVSLRIPIKP